MAKKMNKTLALSRDVLAKETVEKVQSMMEADVVAFTEEMNNINTVDELKKVEEDLMKIFDENDKYLQNVTYGLEAEVEYDGKLVKRSDIINFIIGFINRIEVEFRATLGIYQAIKYWKTKGADNVPYAVFDSTLRMLGTLKFKGEKDCFEILVVNNWFAGAHDSYIRDNAYTNYLAAKHQAIMSRMEELEKKAAEATADATV